MQCGAQIIDKDLESNAASMQLFVLSGVDRWPPETGIQLEDFAKLHFDGLSIHRLYWIEVTADQIDTRESAV